MSRLIIQSGAQAGEPINLPPGSHRLGRSDQNDICIPEPSVSSCHCELNVSDIGVAVHDLGSTNGTFINGQQVTKGMLNNGDRLRTGDVEYVAELSEVHIAIPDTKLPEAPGAAFLEDGTPACFNHRSSAAAFRCTGCENWWCVECVRQLKRVSGDFLNFCPDCSAACVALNTQMARRKKTFFQRVGETLRITPKS